MALKQVPNDTYDIEAEARKELRDERTKDAKAKLKVKLREIEGAKRVLVNLESELEVLRRDIGEELAATGA